MLKYRCWSLYNVGFGDYLCDRQVGQCCPGSHIQRSVVSVDNDQSWPVTHRPCTIHMSRHRDMSLYDTTVIWSVTPDSFSHFLLTRLDKRHLCYRVLVKFRMCGPVDGLWWKNSWHSLQPKYSCLFSYVSWYIYNKQR